MSVTADPTGSVAVALEHAARLLGRNPVLALEQTEEILKAAPNHPVATLLKGIAYRRSGDTDTSVSVLSALCDAQHRWAQAHYELGVSLIEAEQPREAVRALRKAVEVKPDLPDAWRALGDALTVLGEAEQADRAYASHIKFSTRDPRLLEPASALVENDIPKAERLLRAHLRQYPDDVAALRMLAEVGARLGRLDDAEAMLARCLELAPSFTAARYNHAMVLHRQNKFPESLLQIEQLLVNEPRNPSYRNLRAVLLTRIGDYEQSLEIYEELLRGGRASAPMWMNYAHALGTRGRTQESIAAYREAIRLQPGFGEPYWSLANLKTFRFTAGDIATMKAALARQDLPCEDRHHFEFALGKALEDAGDYAPSFEHYAAGNLLRRRRTVYDAKFTSERVRRAKALFTAEFFDARRGFGAPARDPIFIVGLPRAGSTLIEQILSSHSQVEGTMELPNIIAIVRELSGKKRHRDESNYPEGLLELGAEECLRLGERYIEETRIQRKTSKPFFIDKMPNNFMYVGLIHLILPNARIIDARRHPLGCCFSGFKQHFAKGQNYTYDLAEIGRYYHDYVELMAHFDAVRPGLVHRVIYERMIEDTEAEVRKLLDYCRLEFEEGCLRYYENERAVRTASAQQVRRPIFREGLEQWKNYEPWLGPLKVALGPVLDAYPAAPQF